MSVHPPITLRCGDTWTFSGPLNDANGNPLNLAGSTFEWTLNSLDLTQNFLTLSNITILNQTTATVQYGPTAAQTASLIPGSYYENLRVILPSGQTLTEVSSIINAAPASGTQPGPLSPPAAPISNDGVMSVTMGGGGNALIPGTQADVQVPFDAVITGITLMADQVGSAVIDIWKVPFASFPPTSGNSICASDLPILSSAQTYQDDALTGWTTKINAGDVVRLNLDSVSTIERLSVSISLVKV